MDSRVMDSRVMDSRVMDSRVMDSRVMDSRAMRLARNIAAYETITQWRECIHRVHLPSAVRYIYFF